MTNTFANDLARWLATNPGLFRGVTREDALSRAYTECPVRAPKESREDQLRHFAEVLKMLGHEPRFIQKFDTAGVPIQNQGHWQLPLPERPRVGPRMRDETAESRRRG